MSNIREFRLAEGLTQEQLAAAVGVTQGAVNQWENGNTYPRIPTLRLVADVLHTTIARLLDEGDEHGEVRDDPASG